MEELVIFRIFSSFPLFGLLLPDVSTLLIYSAKSISPTHIYIECFLFIAIAICTGGIWYLQKQEKNHAGIQMAGTN